MATYASITKAEDPRGRCHPKAHGPGHRHGRHGGPRGAGRFGGEYTDHPDRPGGHFGGGWGGPPWGGPGGRGPGGRGPGGRGGRGPRASRGDIRAGILVLLGEEPMHGYQVMKELADRSGGVWRPSPGSVYPTLQQLQDEGLVVGEEKPGGRRLFSLTDEGKAERDARASEKAPWEAVADELSAPGHELRSVLGQVFAATRQVGEAGTDEQARKAVEILKDTRRALYRILAEDPEHEADAEA